MNKPTIEYVWRQQKDVPVILRRTGKAQMLRLRMPLAEDNRRWLQLIFRYLFYTLGRAVSSMPPHDCSRTIPINF